MPTMVYVPNVNYGWQQIQNSVASRLSASTSLHELSAKQETNRTNSVRTFRSRRHYEIIRQGIRDSSREQ